MICNICVGTSLIDLIEQDLTAVRKAAPDLHIDDAFADHCMSYEKRE